MRKISIFIKEVTEEEETSLRRLEEDKIVRAKGLYALIDGKLVTEDELLPIHFTSDFIKKNDIESLCNKLINVEADVSIDSFVFITVVKLLKEDDYSKIHTINRKVMDVPHNDIIQNGMYYEIIVSYENQGVIYCAGTDYMKKAKDGTILPYYFFFNKAHATKTFKCYKDLPKEEYEYLKKLWNSKKYKTIVEEKSLWWKEFSKKKKYMIDKLKGLYKENSYAHMEKEELNEEKEKIEQIKNTYLNLSLKDKGILQNCMESNVKIDKALEITLNNIQNIQNTKKESQEFKLTAIIIVCFLAFIFIFAAFNGGIFKDSDGGGYNNPNCSCSKGCCTCCEKTSYGDMACHTSCN